MPDDLISYVDAAISGITGVAARFVATFTGMLFYTKEFRGVFATDSVESGAKAGRPPTKRIVPPLTYFVLLCAMHLALAGLYKNIVVEGSGLSVGSISDQVRSQVAYMQGILNGAAGVLGQLMAVAIFAVSMSLIVEVKTWLVCSVSSAIGCGVQSKTVLAASSYAVGTFIICQYVTIASIIFVDNAIGRNRGFDQTVFAYVTLVVSCVLVYRVNQVICDVDKTPPIATFVSWLLGTVMWQFVIAYLCFLLFFGRSSVGAFFQTWAEVWGNFLKQFGP